MNIHNIDDISGLTGVQRVKIVNSGPTNRRLTQGRNEEQKDVRGEKDHVAWRTKTEMDTT